MLFRDAASSREKAREHCHGTRKRAEMGSTMMPYLKTARGWGKAELQQRPKVRLAGVLDRLCSHYKMPWQMC